MGCIIHPGRNKTKIQRQYYHDHKSCLLYTSGIDVGARADFYKIIRDLAKQDIGVIVISSEEDELIGLCNRIIVMREGEKVGEFQSDEQDLKQKMMKLMIGIE